MSRGVTFWLGRTLGWASTACCLVLLASFAIFAVNQTNAASRQQLTELGSVQPPGGGNATGSQPAGTANESPSTQAAHKSGLHEFIDNTAEALTSPFSGLTSSSHSEWIIRGVGTLAALVFYGLALGFAGRVLRVRARTLI